MGSNADLQSDNEAATEFRKVQDSIAECMASEGFEYIPEVLIAAATGHVSPGIQDSQRAFATTFGYGISTAAELAAASSSDNSVSPNVSIQDAMTVAERQAYRQALWGSDVAVADASNKDADIAGRPTDLSSAQGCDARARKAVYAGKRPTYSDLSQFMDLFAAREALLASIDANPQMAPAINAWSSCLAREGYSGYNQIPEPQQDVHERFAAITNRTFVTLPNGTSEYRPLAGHENDLSFEPNPIAAAELEQFEVALATADLDCKVQFYQTSWERVRIELEEQFAIDHLGELEQYSIVMNGG